MKINKGIQGHIWVTIFMLLPILLLYFIAPETIVDNAVYLFIVYIFIQTGAGLFFYLENAYYK